MSNTLNEWSVENPLYFTAFVDEGGQFQNPETFNMIDKKRAAVEGKLNDQGRMDLTQMTAADLATKLGMSTETNWDKIHEHITRIQLEALSKYLGLEGPVSWERIEEMIEGQPGKIVKILKLEEGVKKPQIELACSLFGLEELVDQLGLPKRVTGMRFFGYLYKQRQNELCSRLGVREGGSFQTIMIELNREIEKRICQKLGLAQERGGYATQFLAKKAIDALGGNSNEYKSVYAYVQTPFYAYLRENFDLRGESYPDLVKREESEIPFDLESQEMNTHILERQRVLMVERLELDGNTSLEEAVKYVQEQSLLAIANYLGVGGSEINEFLTGEYRREVASKLGLPQDTTWKEITAYIDKGSPKDIDLEPDEIENACYFDSLQYWDLLNKPRSLDNLARY